MRFLLAHHSASSNSYTEAGVPGLIRGFYGFHTGPDKRWPDVAYSFFVDKFGGVWEGRTGSTAKPVAGSATGGNQGYTRLCCLIGDYSATTPTESQQASLVKLLATLADWHGIDTAPGAQTTFVSKGSNKHPRGTQVTTRTIEGHRSMSTTSCPGDSAYALVPGLQARVTKLRAG